MPNRPFAAEDKESIGDHSIQKLVIVGLGHLPCGAAWIWMPYFPSAPPSLTNRADQSTDVRACRSC